MTYPRAGITSRPVIEHERGEDWRKKAACRDADPEIFFPEKLEFSPETKSLVVASAKVFCRSCEVLKDCFEWGNSTEPRTKNIHGIIAAETADERMSRRRRESRWKP